ncbi:MAG TPA: biotin synthase BioB [Nitrososphaeraceae archaeon]|jgi:biotin synthase|nr:biotin synthase BioB [Nitrososphaeraceae archaeon]
MSSSILFSVTDHVDDVSFIYDIMKKVVDGGNVEFEEADRLLDTRHILTLAKCANIITRKFTGELVDVEMLINAKAGRCPEDCSFCAQSTFYDSQSGIDKYPLLPKQIIIEQAQKAKQGGANSFCLVCAYRTPSEKDFEQICDTIVELKKKVAIDVNVSLGFMTRERARRLKSIGVKRYNHNLETPESLFAQICKTHDFKDRVNTAKIVKEEGLELCCGGIIGMGETLKQRLELAFAIKSLRPDEVPINILIPRQGTPLANLPPMEPTDAIKTIAVWRFIMPKTILKIAGGRELHLKDKERLALKAGANGIITGGYLTTRGNNIEKDMTMIKEIGLKVA